MGPTPANVNPMTELAADPPLGFLDRGDGEKLAYFRRSGNGPGLVWLNGFKSDMSGNKARTLDSWAARTGRACLRFDAFAHGLSSGDFAKATIGRWLDDAVAAFDALTEGPQIVVGSSLGGWIALLLAERRAARVAGLVLIAPAPDFTERLMWPDLAPETQTTILREGVCMMPWPYGEPYPLTRRMFEEARTHLVLDRTVAYEGPVRILQGLDDEAIPVSHALATAAAVASKDIVLTLIKGGDHRLSTEPDLARLVATVESF